MFDEYGNIKVLDGSTYRFSRENDCSMIALYSRWIIGYSLNNRAISNASCGWRGANNAARSRGRKAKLPGAQRSSERPVFFCFRQKMNDLRALHGQAAGNVIHSVLTRKSAKMVMKHNRRKKS